MHKVDAPGATPANEFTDGDPQSGVPATTLEAKFMNTLQRELVNVVEQENIELDDQDDSQLYQSIQSLVQSMLDNTIAPDTRMLFVQDAAPSGWSQDNQYNDRVIRVSNNSGGEVGGNWVINGLTHNHEHSVRAESRGFNNDAPARVQMHTGTGGLSFVSFSSHQHRSIVGDTRNITTSEIFSDGDWRPAYVDVIACIKN